MAKKFEQKNFMPGDEWLYYKIYAGPKTSDTILKDHVSEIASKLFHQKIIIKWFFIRYQDPNHHIRLRFQLKDKKDCGNVMNLMYTFFSKLLSSGLVWNIKLDVYQREINRYGNSSISLSEDIFHCSSELVVRFLKLMENSSSEDTRWLFSLKAMDNFLDAFDLPLTKKFLLLEIAKTRFQNEFGIKGSYKRQIDKKFRAQRGSIDRFMLSQNFSDEGMNSIQNLLKSNLEETKPFAIRLVDMENRQELDVFLDDLLLSFLHMLMNRLFTSKNRIFEMVCYDFLYRHYKSKVARRNA